MSVSNILFSQVTLVPTEYITALNEILSVVSCVRNTNMTLNNFYLSVLFESGDKANIVHESTR